MLRFAIVFGLASTAIYAQSISGCNVFPADNVWNHAVDTLPLDSRSATYVSTIGSTKTAHADFGAGLYAGGPIGIPFVVVAGTQPKVAVSFQYASESDKGPYPIPANAPIEGGASSTGDRHVLVVDKTACVLYELYSAFPQPDGSWKAGSGAVFPLNSDALRPATWTSADAAGLPVLPGLIRYDEVAAGEIKHALRFTAPKTRKAYIWPARHYASSLTATQYPPMGQRFRLKSNFDISKYAPEVQVILKALKKYGMFLADNGSSWFLSGAPDDRWNNDHLHQLSQLTGANFEAVDESALMVNVNSGATGSGVAAHARVLHSGSQSDAEPEPATVDVTGEPLAGGVISVNVRNLGFDDPMVLIGGQEAEIVDVSASSLTVRVPGDLFASQVPVQVRSRTHSDSPRIQAIAINVR
jgi:hypothetical protein